MLEENQKVIKNFGRKEERNSMNNVLMLLYLLKGIEIFQEDLLKTSKMREHTFIIKSGEILNIRKVTLKEDVSDETIKEVMRWQKKGPKQN